MKQDSCQFVLADCSRSHHWLLVCLFVKQDSRQFVLADCSTSHHWLPVCLFVKQDSCQFVLTSAVWVAACHTELESVRSSDGFVELSSWSRSHCSAAASFASQCLLNQSLYRPAWYLVTFQHSTLSAHGPVVDFFFWGGGGGYCVFEDWIDLFFFTGVQWQCTLSRRTPWTSGCWARSVAALDWCHPVTSAQKTSTRACWGREMGL